MGNILEMDILNGGTVQQQSFTYDSQGQRLTKTTKDALGQEYTITYHYFNGQVLYETKSGDANNILHALYINYLQGKPLECIWITI